MTDNDYMQLAIDICTRGVEAGQSPFGAVIVLDGQVLAADHNHVWLQTDPTAHAEVQAIRAACRKIASPHLTGATIYSTTEPCPMCFSAIHWARISRIVFGARIQDAIDFGFRELQIRNDVMKEVSGSTIDITPDVQRDGCVDVYRYWRKLAKSEAY